MKWAKRASWHHGASVTSADDRTSTSRFRFGVEDVMTSDAK